MMQPLPTAMATTTAATSATSTAATTQAASKELTLEEKQRLAQTINDMQVSSLLGVVNILMKYLPDLKVCGARRGAARRALVAVVLQREFSLSVVLLSVVGGGGGGGGGAHARMHARRTRLATS